MTDFHTDCLLHGGDYNPEQWLETPEIWDEDMRLMNLAHVNSASIGIFSWTSYEAEEGVYNFDWLDAIFEKLAQHDKKIILATPSGAKPHWLAQKYPEIRRVGKNGLRDAQQARHNHCPTSPVYREKIGALNGELARRYGKHPALILWHISNEYGGHCYCDLCFGAFREWLKARYGDLDTLNRAYWSRFWSHTYTDWSQIDYIDPGVHALSLDWNRFMTHQMVDFMRHEIAALREFSSLPTTTNLMSTYPALDYNQFAPHIDVVSWDAYPEWGHHGLDESATAAHVAFNHDLMRGLQRRPFLLMENTPSQVNWNKMSPLKRPGVHRFASLQAIAHGSDSVQYFQWRKSRGSSEKFHGAVVDHAGHENTRVFREVAALGADMEALSEVAGAPFPAEVALFYDWENRWVIDSAQTPFNQYKNYEDTVREWYRALWQRSIGVDVVQSTTDISGYRLVIAPMLHMLRPGVAENLRAFVQNGGTLVTTYFSGCVDENDLTFLGGFPGPLRDVCGIWAEEWQVLPQSQTQSVVASEGRYMMSGAFEARQICEIIHAESADVLATYGDDFYKGSPALTANNYGAGRAYYVASRNEARFQDEFLKAICTEINIQPVAGAVQYHMPSGVSVQRRAGEKGEWLFAMNFSDTRQSVQLSDADWRDVLAGENAGYEIDLRPYDVKVLQRKAK